MKKTWIAAALLLVVAAPAAFAQSSQFQGLYGELGYTTLSDKESVGNIVGDVAWNLGALRGLVGYAFSPNLAVEGMLAGGVADNSQTATMRDSGAQVALKSTVTSIAGLYVKGKANLSKDFEVFGRIGIASVDRSLNVDTPGYTISNGSSSGSDVSYGLGAQYNFTPKVAATLDYMSYYNKDSISVTGFTLGVAYKF